MSTQHENLQTEGAASWYMRIDSGDVYGPVDIATLKEWAAQGRIEPENEISEDKTHWHPAQALSALQMDWIAELEDGTHYGPFNRQLAPDLIENGILPPDVTLTHRETGEARTMDVNDHPTLPFDVPPDNPEPEPEPTPPTTESEAETSASPPATSAPDADTAPDASTNTTPKTSAPAEEVPSATEAESAVAPPQTDSAATTEALTAARRELVTQRGANTAMEDEIQKLKDDIQSAEAAKDDYEKQLVEQENALADAQADVENLKAQLTQLQEHYDRLQAENQNQFEALDNLRAETMEKDQAYTRKLAEAADRVTAKTALLGQALGILIQDPEIEDERVPEAFLSHPDTTRLTELQTRLTTLQKQIEHERRETRRLEAHLETLQGARSRRVLVGALLVLVLGLTGTLAFVLGTRRTPAPDSPPPTPGTQQASPNPQSLPPPAAQSASPTTTAGNPELNLAPEKNEHPAEVTERGPIDWPDLKLSRGTLTKTAKEYRIVFNYGIFSSGTRKTQDAARDLVLFSNQIREHTAAFTLRVVGHTDATPITSSKGKYVDNYALGMARAEAAKAFLVHQCQLPENFIRTASAGKTDPPHPNDTAASRRRNRTVVLTLMPR